MGFEKINTKRSTGGDELSKPQLGQCQRRIKMTMQRRELVDGTCYKRHRLHSKVMVQRIDAI